MEPFLCNIFVPVKEFTSPLVEVSPLWGLNNVEVCRE
jgi:hypothetical protein